MSASDPFLVLWELTGKQKTQIGSTELIADSMNPEWVKSIDVDYMFETQQTFLVQIYDADQADKLHDLSKHDFVGQFEFTLSKVVSGKNQELEGKLENTKNATVKI